jgi:hypothetical protein
MAPRAALDLVGGHVQIAARRVAVRAGVGSGRVQVGDTDGPVLRSPTFGERTRLVAASLGSAHPAIGLAAALVAALRERAGTCDAATERVVALLLAGAGEPGPPLVDTACMVARASGSPLQTVEALDAMQVDFYARRLVSDPDPDDGWHRVVLAAPREQRDATDLPSADDDAIVQELAEVLLDRGRARASESFREVAAGGDATGAQSPRATAVARDPAAIAEPDESAWRDVDQPGLIDGTPPSTNDPASSARPSEPLPPEPAPSTQVMGVRPMPPTPLLRFRQPVAAPSTTRARTPTLDAVPDAAVPRFDDSAAAAPASTTRWSEHVRSVDGHSPTAASWEPSPWRLDRGGRSAIAAPREGAPRVGAAFVAAPASDAAPCSGGARPLHAARSADEVADFIADGLRREAARRGLVP